LENVIFWKGVRYAKCFIFIIMYFTAINLFSQVYFEEIPFAAGTDSGCAFELYNFSNAPVNLNNYVISNGIDTLHVGNMTIAAKDLLIVRRFDKPLFCQSNELALYSDISIFPSDMVDYIQFRGIASSNLSSIAVANNLWKDVSDFIPFIINPVSPSISSMINTNKAARDGTDTTLNHWRPLRGANAIGSLNPCPTNYTNDINQLNFIIDSYETKYADYETNGPIESTQLIRQGARVDYDSSLDITLLGGFEVENGAEFLAFIDGCDLGEGGLH